MMQQADIDLWKLGITAAGLLATFITVTITVLKERHASRERLRDEFRFSVEVQKARAELESLSRLSEQNAINALLGRRDVPAAVGRYLIDGFLDADVAIRAYRRGRGRVVFEDGADPRFDFKGINRRKWFRQIGKTAGTVGYFVSCGFAVCPLLLAMAGRISEGQAFQLLPGTLVVGLAVAIPVLLWGAGFARAEKLIKLQEEAIADRARMDPALSA